jgi:hypothetical protein
LEKLFGFLGVLFLAGIGLHFSNFESASLSSVSSSSSSAKLFKEWNRDLTQLKAKKQLPSGFDSIKEIRYTPMSKMSAQWISGTRIPISLNHEGKYRLSVEVDHWVEKQKAAAIINYQLIDIKSGNTVWEFGRTYPIR